MVGVPSGYKHDWKYKVKKYFEKGNNFTEVQSKSRNRKTKVYGNLKKGSKIIWKLNGRFYTKRVPGGWKTVYKMKKHKLRIKPKGKRWT